MATHIALLRAVNVGGHNKIKMADLRTALEHAGLTNVATYVQSGNVVCTSRKGAAAVAKAIHNVIAEQFGHDITVIVRSPAELAALVAGFPWDEPNPKASGIVFLTDSADPIDAAKFAPDELAVVGRDVYVNYATSFSESKLTPAWIEKTAGRPGTRRNWNTVLKLAEMATA